MFKYSDEFVCIRHDIFKSKQSSMFVAIDKLFTLHNAILLKSRVIKAFLVYSLLIFTIYMFTSTKQTYSLRSRLYVGERPRYDFKRTLNHEMLQSLIEKVNGMQGKKQFLCEDDDDSDVDWSSWVDKDISDNELEDLDYRMPL
ncbi:hypothetical protein HanOQP8_Chr05g0182681 [Helianthus annuus]|nr:hypothetical protein HanOQP8_Chr05g0182681 [Helianthus annuus]KAJ0749531.1 hypothetical protein HanLR1_Chr05g0170991 [Helianthus annuus]